MTDIRVLNDEEIASAIDKAWGAQWRSGWAVEEVIEDGDREVAKAQHQKDLGDFIGLLDERVASKSKRIAEALYGGPLKETLRIEINELNVLKHALKQLVKE